jgi:hypothetical protein
MESPEIREATLLEENFYIKNLLEAGDAASRHRQMSGDFDEYFDDAE